jgi:hypothetical protein
LALAFEIRTAVSRSRSSGFDSADERRQPALGCARIHGELLKLGIEISQADKLEVRSLSEPTGKAGPLAEPGPQFDFNRADYFAAFTLRVRPAF